ncbi:MAG: arylsulfatase [Verrucomicrobiia bacterium]
MRVEFFVIIVLAFASSWALVEPLGSSRPNILIVLADDLGYSDPGCYGGEIATPHLDRLAEKGLRFTQFYTTARCWPTRAALMTGYYPQQVRMDPPRGRVPTWGQTLPQMLRPHGYRSYHAGKWHVSGVPRTCADAGFEHSYRLEDHDRNFNPKRLIEDDQDLPPVPADSGYYTATAFADRLIAYLKEHAQHHPDRPFFAFLAFTTPHFPLQAPPEDIARYTDRFQAGWEAMRAERYHRQREIGLIQNPLPPPEPTIRAPSGAPEVEKQIDLGEVAYAVPWHSLNAEQKRFQASKMAIHAAMVDRLDRETGRVIDQLKAMGAYENTIIFFLSDNGASAEILVRGDRHDPSAPPGSAASYLCLGPGWSTVCNTPFRRHKIWVHEGGISTPLIVHWPKGIAAQGELRFEPGHLVDLVPTILELVGALGQAQPAGAPPYPGRSLVPYFANPLERAAATERTLFFHHEGNRAIRIGDWKLVSSRIDGGVWSLYDLATDRSESVDLASGDPVRVKEMAWSWQSLQDLFARQATDP